MIFLKIALLISSLSGGGAERVTSNIANYLYNHDNNITLITMSDIRDTYEVSNSINRVYLLHDNERKNKVYNAFLRYKRLKKFVIENQDIDCYIVMLPKLSFMLATLKKHMNAKLIFSERNNPKSYPLYKRCMMKYVQKKCDGLVVQTKVIAKWYNVKNSIIIPNAINKGVLIKKERKDIKNKIVAVGRLEKQKNYPMMIKAFSIFSKNNPNYTLEIYGQGKLENELKELSKELCIDDKVIFRGYVQNVSEKIIDAKMFVMTSNFEGMPNALIEAMCLGIPCIATDCDGGGARELINNMENGILIDKNDIKSLISSMYELTSNPKLYAIISKNVVKINKTLDYESIYEKWYKYISDITNINYL